MNNNVHEITTTDILIIIACCFAILLSWLPLIAALIIAIAIAVRVFDYAFNGFRGHKTPILNSWIFMLLTILSVATLNIYVTGFVLPQQDFQKEKVIEWMQEVGIE